MKATIYHNPNCGTSRKTLEILREAGADVTVIEYLKTPPSKAELKRLYARAGIDAARGAAGQGAARRRTSTWSRARSATRRSSTRWPTIRS